MPEVYHCDLVVENARLLDGSLVDLVVADGRFAEVGPGGTVEAAVTPRRRGPAGDTGVRQRTHAPGQGLHAADAR